MVDYESLRNGYQRPSDPIQQAEIGTVVAEFAPERVLEVGCSTGRLLSRFEQLGCRPVGVDLNRRALSKASANVLQADAMSLPFGDETFDLTVANHVMEHVDDADIFMKEIVRVTKPDGKLLLSYPDEPIRGLFATWASVRMFGHPFGARKMHVRRVKPEDFDSLAEKLPVKHISSRRSRLPLPQFFTLLSKI